MLGHISAIPQEVIALIFSHLSPEDLSSASQINRLFLHISKNPVIWRNLIQTYFPHLNTTHKQRIQFTPKEVFLEEYSKWRITAQALQMKTRVLLAVLAGKYSEAEKSQLSEEDQSVITLLTQARQYIRATVKPATLDDNLQLRSLLTALFPKAFPGVILCFAQCNEKTKTLISNLYESTPTKYVDLTLLNTIFREHLVSESQGGRSLFDKLKKLSLEELKTLKAALNEMCIMMTDFDDLNEAEQAVVNTMRLTQEDIRSIDDYCREFFDEAYDKFFENGVKTPFGQVQSGLEYFSQIAKNALVQYASEILKKIDTEIELKNQIRLSMLTALNNAKTASTISEPMNKQPDRQTRPQC